MGFGARAPAFRRRVVFGLLLAGVAVPSIAAAQSAPTQNGEQTSSPPADDQSKEREDITVIGRYTTNDRLDSATGLGLTIQETPQSVTVVTEQRLYDQQLRSLSDAINNAAGVSSKNYDSSRNGYSARGFIIDNYLVDGVPVQYDPGYSAGESELDLSIYDRVEIVRGATGLLSGAGNPSASINLVRKHATSDHVTGSLVASAGRWNDYLVQGDISAPVTSDGSVRVRGVARYQDSDSYVDLLGNRKLVLYGVVDADLTPSTRLSAGASYQDNDPRATTWGGLSPWYADGSRTDWPRSKTIGANWTRWATKQRAAFVNLEQDLGADWTLRLYGNYTRNTGDLHLLFLYGQPDRTTGIGLGASPARYDSIRDQWDTMARLTGTYTLFGRRHELIVGASYAKQKLDFLSYATNYANLAPVGDFNAWDGSYPEPVWTDRSLALSWNTKQWGYYAATRLSLADSLKVILGGRLGSWTRDGMAWGTPTNFGRKNRLVPYAGVLYDLTSNHTIYASYTDIFQPQDYQDRNGDFLAPVKGSNYEAGLKSSFFGGRLKTALSVFRVQQDNLGQEDQGYFIPGTINPAYRAVSGAKSTGFEVEANGEVTPGWAISMNYTQFKAKDRDGGRVNTLYPQKLLRLFTTYEVRSGTLNGLTLGGGVNWEGSSYTDTTNPVTKVPERLQVNGYAIANVMVRYPISERLSLQVNADNIFDKKYYSQIGFYNQLAYGRPADVKATLRYAF
ncbi:TonB-dependent siderophore receptor [Sphingomonas sp. NCPPB 2930]|uniref:TonB-dependent siderophore receptor n=1 Tax=Sphingomonas sp. NCPPB 2930 TaxID=3162788 RepID=UPI0036D915F9